MDEERLAEIWKGDQLRRKDEAILLERFLVDESNRFNFLNRNQSIVLALDAPYGEGKSWFLERFRKQLALNHPVAFVDAWVDDGYNQPLVSIMAAVEGALERYIKKPKFKEFISGLRKSAIPLIGKGALAAASKAAGRYLGDAFVAEASQAASGAAERKEAAKEVATAGTDAVATEIATLIEGAGKAELTQYKLRQESRLAFRSNLAAIAALLAEARDGTQHAPIFVVIDELDRCRPPYALSLLEDIKHLFDVPGVVFVIALHGDQLERSVHAVYGEQFDAQGYMRRFFTRPYRLRRLSITELVESHGAELEAYNDRLAFPRIVHRGQEVQWSSVKLTGELLSDWKVTPREAIAILDAMRLFLALWPHEVSVELLLLVPLCLNLVRNKPDAGYDTPNSSHPRFFVNPRSGDVKPVRAEDIISHFARKMSYQLNVLAHEEAFQGVEGYVRERFAIEFQTIHKNNYNTPPKSVMQDYRKLIASVGQLAEEV